MSPGISARIGFDDTRQLSLQRAGGCRQDGRHERDGVGGAGRDRTGDLRLAKAALSQLSYSPEGVGGPKWIRTTDLTLIRRALSTN